MNNILIEFIGDANVGKTTVSSIFAGLPTGEVKRKQNTLEATLHTIKNTLPHITPDEIYNWIDAVDLQFVPVIRDTIALDQNYVKNGDLLVIIVDVTVGVTEELKAFLSKNISSLKLFILNKYDEDDEELVEYTNDIIKHLETDQVILLNSLPIYECMFNSDSKKAIIYKNAYNGNIYGLYEKCGLFNLRNNICKFINENMQLIYDTRLQQLNCNNVGNIENLVNVYHECSKNTPLNNSLEHYINILFKFNTDNVECNCDEDGDDEFDYDDSEDEEDNYDDNDENDNNDEEDDEDDEDDNEDDNNDNDDECNDIDINIFEGAKNILKYLSDSVIVKIVNKYYTITSYDNMNTFEHYFGYENKICIIESFKIITNYVIMKCNTENVNMDSILNKYASRLNMIQTVTLNECEITELHILFVNMLRKYCILMFNMLNGCDNTNKMSTIMRNKVYTNGKKYIELKILESKYYPHSHTKFLQLTNKYGINCVNDIILKGFTSEKTFCAELLGYLQQNMNFIKNKAINDKNISS